MEDQETVPPATVRIINIKKLLTKSNAQRQKEYRERKKSERKRRKEPKTNAKRQQEFRQNRLAHQTEESYLARKRKDAEHAKRYRDRLKFKRLCANAGSFTSSKEDSLSTLIIKNFTQFQIQTNKVQEVINDEAQQVKGPSLLSFQASDKEHNDPLAVEMAAANSTAEPDTPGSNFVKCEPVSPLDCNIEVKTEPHILEGAPQLKLVPEIKVDKDPECRVPVISNIVQCAVKTEPEDDREQDAASPQMKLVPEIKVDKDPECHGPVISNIVQCAVKTEPVDDGEQEAESTSEPERESVGEIKCEFYLDPDENRPVASYCLEKQMTDNAEPVRKVREATSEPVRESVGEIKSEFDSDSDEDLPLASYCLTEEKSEKQMTDNAEPVRKVREATSEPVRESVVQIKCEFELDTDEYLPLVSSYLEQQMTVNAEPVRERREDSSHQEQTQPHPVHIKTEPVEDDQGGAVQKSLSKRRAERKPSGKKPRKRSAPSRPGEKPHECDVCHKRFGELCHLIAHFSVHTEEKLHVCNICQRQFTRRSNLKTHLRLHTGESLFECSVCQSRFTSKSKLELHSKRHTGEKPYECDLCRNRFADKCTLKRHMRTHSGEKPFECSTCFIRFTERTSLQAHLTTHTGEKPYKCDVCPKRFSRKGNLQTHLRRHTGEKPFECSVCNNRFTEKSTLIRHARTHTGEKPYECHICSSRFTLKTKLKRHMKKHTAD